MRGLFSMRLTRHLLLNLSLNSFSFWRLKPTPSLPCPMKDADLISGVLVQGDVCFAFGCVYIDFRYLSGVPSTRRAGGLVEVGTSTVALLLGKSSYEPLCGKKERGCSPLANLICFLFLFLSLCVIASPKMSLVSFLNLDTSMALRGLN